MKADYVKSQEVNHLSAQHLTGFNLTCIYDDNSKDS